jgi:manganese oxidase
MKTVLRAGKGANWVEASGRILYSAAALSFAAEAIHLWVTPDHYLEWLGYGIFFLAAAVFQGFLGAALLFRPRRWVFLLGAIGNLAVVLLWAYTRAVAVPLGPMAGEAEPLGVLDFACTSAEVVLVTLLAALWWRCRKAAPGLRRTRGSEPSKV